MTFDPDEKQIQGDEPDVTIVGGKISIYSEGFRFNQLMSSLHGPNGEVTYDSMNEFLRALSPWEKFTLRERGLPRTEKAGDFPTITKVDDQSVQIKLTSNTGGAPLKVNSDEYKSVLPAFVNYLNQNSNQLEPRVIFLRQKAQLELAKAIEDQRGLIKSGNSDLSFLQSSLRYIFSVIPDGTSLNITDELGTIYSSIGFHVIDGEPLVIRATQDSPQRRPHEELVPFNQHGRISEMIQEFTMSMLIFVGQGIGERKIKLKIIPPRD